MGHEFHGLKARLQVEHGFCFVLIEEMELLDTKKPSDSGSEVG